MTDAQRFFAVSRTDPGFRYGIYDYLVWYSDLIVQNANSDVQATVEQRAFITDSIESLLLAKRYRLTEDG